MRGHADMVAPTMRAGRRDSQTAIRGILQSPPSHSPDDGKPGRDFLDDHHGSAARGFLEASLTLAA